MVSVAVGPIRPVALAGRLGYRRVFSCCIYGKGIEGCALRVVPLLPMEQYGQGLGITGVLGVILGLSFSCTTGIYIHQLLIFSF